MAEQERRDPVHPAEVDSPSASPAQPPRPPTVGTRAVAHTKWILAAPIVAKLLGLAATVVLARLLAPAEFGLIAYAATTLAFFSVFQNLGITQALIADPGDVSSKLRPALFMSVVSGCLFYAVLALAAFPLAHFLAEPLLGPILVSMGLVVVLQTCGQVHHALLIRAEAYRVLFVVTVLQALSYLVVALALAGWGAGVWALVLGQLAAQFTRTALLWLCSGWRPGFHGARDKLFSAHLLRFGGALTLVNILDWAGDGWVFFSIGKVLGSQSLGVYNLCFEASRMSYFGLPALAFSVVLTSYSSLLENPEELRRLMLKGLRVVHALAFPLAAGIVALAPWIVPVVWGPKWLDAIPVLSVLALLGFSAPLVNVLIPYFVSSGRLKTLIRLTGFRLVGYVIVISIVTQFGVRAVAVAHIALMCVVAGVIALIAVRSIGARLADVRAAILWPAARAAVCGLAAGAVARVLDGMAPALVLLPAVATGGLVYVAILYATDREALYEAASVLARGIGVIPHGR